MNREKIIESSKNFAEAMLRNTGEVRPCIAVFSRGRVAVLPYDGTKNDQWAIVQTLKVCRKAKQMDFAVLISEAWMAKLPKGVLPGDAPRASEMPNREEVIAVHAIMAGGLTATGTWHIKRDAQNKPSLADKVEYSADARHESWLDDALKDD